jgi:uncharacterized surface protein with fasciclin (FAS1) repeats
MGTISKISKILSLAVLATLMNACSNEAVEKQEETEANTLSEAVLKTDNLRLFNEAITLTNFNPASEVSETSRSMNSYTVFAPTNDAFRMFLKENGFTSIAQVPREVLLNVLANHVVMGKYMAADLSTGYLKTNAFGSASKTNSLSLFVNTTNGVSLNGVSKVIRADLRFAKNVIHVVDKVIPLPTIVTHAVANSNFKTLVGALTSNGQPDFVSILSGKGPYTVFAPTNGAFDSLNTELQPGGIASVSSSNLTKVLTYHVANGNVLSNSLSDGMSVPTLLTQNFTINLNPAKITDANGRMSKIIAVDVQCTNGVIHVIDKVLLPTL